MVSTTQPGQPNARVRIVVATSVMLTFISFWRAAAIVLNDLGSSAFYAAGIAEEAVGKAGPWFVVIVMLFAFCVRAVYVESCSMFVRGGVYRVVKEALGGMLAKISVSALMFDYILTGPISGVSAGHYISGLLNELLALAHRHGFMPRAIELPDNLVAVVFALGVTFYYWRQNTKGIEESSEKSLRVMQITTVMVVILLVWSAITLIVKQGWQLPPLPSPSNLRFTRESLGFLWGSDLPTTFGLFGILLAFGHSVLAMSGEESLAQVNREIAHPKLKNLKRAAIVIGIYSFVFTGVSAVLAGTLIPDDVRIPVYRDNLISGLAMYMAGPHLLRLLFRIFVVFVGFLMLSGAVNTAIIGSNGVLNRVSEDGVLTDWFRKPHKRFGTSYRIINLVVGLQVLTILASRGNVFVLGEAYAFGVIWSFTFNSLAMLVLRFKFKGERGWKVPPNLRIGNTEIPLGLLSVHLVLLSTAIANLFTKRIATVAGIAFALSFFLVFVASERVNRRKFAGAERQMKEHFQLLHREQVDRESVGIRPGNILVTVRDYNTLNHLRWVLERVNTHEQDVVVMSARLTGAGSGQYDLAMEQIFSDYEQTLFTRAVSVAESFGKHISLLVVPARDIWSAIVQTANALECSAVVAGLSSKMTAQEQAFELGKAWEAAPEPKRQFILQVVRPDMVVETFTIGPHTPAFKTEDVHLVHRLWLNATRERGLERLHHSDIVTMALSRFAREFAGRERDEILRDLHKIEDDRHPHRRFSGDGSRPTEDQPAEKPTDHHQDPRGI
jgi:amino acid transporter